MRNFVTKEFTNCFNEVVRIRKEGNLYCLYEITSEGTKVLSSYDRESMMKIYKNKLSVYTKRSYITNRR